MNAKLPLCEVKMGTLLHTDTAQPDKTKWDYSKKHFFTIFIITFIIIIYFIIIYYSYTGYQRQLTYKRQDGSYSAFGERDSSGSMW